MKHNSSDGLIELMVFLSAWCYFLFKFFWWNPSDLLALL